MNRIHLNTSWRRTYSWMCFLFTSRWSYNWKRKENMLHVQRRPICSSVKMTDFPWSICLYRHADKSSKSRCKFTPGEQQGWKTCPCAEDFSVCWCENYHCFFLSYLTCLLGTQVAAHPHRGFSVYHSLSKWKLEMLVCLCYHLTKASKLSDGRLVVRSFSGNSNRKLRNLF